MTTTPTRTELELAMYAGVFADAKARHLAARDELRAMVAVALDAGMTEVQAAKIAGVTRMTIRAWRRGVAVSSA